MRRFTFIALLMCISLNNSSRVHAVDTPHKNSYILAGTGALISPVIGHTYIGENNIPRGFWYSANELFLGFATIRSAFPDFHTNLSMSTGMHSILRPGWLLPALSVALMH